MRDRSDATKVNPFRYGDLVVDDAFTDRARELDDLKSDIRNGQNVALIAPRRYGKSSLVHRATQDLLAEDILVVEVDLMSTPTKEKLASKLAKSIHDDVASVLFSAKERLRIFSSFRVVPIITINPETGSPSFSFTGAKAEQDIDDTLERLFELPAELAADGGKRIVLFFDEFQEITDIDRKLPAQMRAVFQRQPHVAHLYAGSKRDMMRRLFTHENEPFFRSAKIMDVGAIPADVFKAFVLQRFEQSERGVDREVLDELLEITRGHPYGTQELAYALWEEVPHGFTANSGDLHNALAAVLRSENAHFSLLWDRASRTQRILLQALGSDPARPLSHGFRELHDLPAASTVQRALEVLLSEELVARMPDGRVAIVEPFLREWITAYAA